ncbi:MAG: hypothetical protein AB8H80_06970, partial [Planctomycetota bacterium]
RVFFGKTTAGKRVEAPDYTKAYIGFGVAAVVIIGIFIAMSGGGSGNGDGNSKKQNASSQAKKPVDVQFGRGDHPRAQQIAKWAAALGDNNQLVLGMHTDTRAIATQLGIEEKDKGKILNAMREHADTELLRTMNVSAELVSEADMTASEGKALLTVTAKEGDERFYYGTNGMFELTFRMDGSAAQVSSFKMTREPAFKAGKKPGIVTYSPNEDIAKPEAVEITDSAGTRKVTESKPTPVPHWKDASPELRQLADEVVAGIRAAAEPDARGGMFNRAAYKIRSDEQKKAAVPRVLNALHDCYGDVIGKHQEILLLDRALGQWLGYAVNYPAMPSGDNAADTKKRQSCIRQWFAFWYRNSNNWDEWFNRDENLDDEDEGDEEGGGE